MGTSVVGMLRALSTTLMARASIAAAAGRTFDGDRDLYKALGYKRSLRVEDYRARYYRNALAARIIEAYPRATWRGKDLELIETETPEIVTEFEQAWLDLDKRLKVRVKLRRTDILAGLGEYAVLLIGAPGNLADPLPKPLNLDDIMFLAPFAQDEAAIKTFIVDKKDKRFGHPEFYQLSRINRYITTAKFDEVVHWSRVIHVADGALEDDIYGRPRLERVWNLLDDLEKITGGGAEAFWLRAHQGYQLELDPEVEFDEEAEKKLQEEVDDFLNRMRRVVRTRGVTINTLGSDTADFDRNVASIIDQISSGTSIPQRILMGSERGQLASEQDRNNWIEQVQDRRHEYAEPVILRPFVDRLIEHEALPAVDYQVRWPQIHDLPEAERVGLAVKYAELNAKQRRIVVTSNEIRDRVLGMDPLDELEDELEEQDELDVTVEEDDDNPEGGDGSGALRASARKSRPSAHRLAARSRTARRVVSARD